MYLKAEDVVEALVCVSWAKSSSSDCRTFCQPVPGILQPLSNVKSPSTTSTLRGDIFWIPRYFQMVGETFFSMLVTLKCFGVAKDSPTYQVVSLMSLG